MGVFPRTPRLATPHRLRPSVRRRLDITAWETQRHGPCRPCLLLEPFMFSLQLGRKHRCVFGVEHPKQRRLRRQARDDRMAIAIASCSCDRLAQVVFAHAERLQ
jgi:hypothetical protein